MTGLSTITILTALLVTGAPQPPVTMYRVIVTGGCGAPVTSNAVNIVIVDNPVITVQPVAPAAVCEGSGIQIMSVTATGYNLTYRWQENQGAGWNNVVNGGIYSGALTNSLTPVS